MSNFHFFSENKGIFFFDDGHSRISGSAQGTINYQTGEINFIGPVNIGSNEMVSINQLAEMAMDIAGKNLTINHIDGPLGVRGRNSDNQLIKEKLGWAPNWPLRKGMELTYKWIAEQVEKKKLMVHGNSN